MQTGRNRFSINNVDSNMQNWYCTNIDFCDILYTQNQFYL